MNIFGITLRDLSVVSRNMATTVALSRFRRKQRKKKGKPCGSPSQEKLNFALRSMSRRNS